MLNCRIYDDGNGERVLFIEDEITHGTLDSIQDAINLLGSACDKYVSSGFNEEYLESMELAAAAVGELLETYVVCPFYEWEYFIDGATCEDVSNLPITWMDSEDNVYWISIVEGNIISSITVDTWSWETSNGEASDKATKNSYKAVQRSVKNEFTGERYGDKDFSYKVWNDLVDKTKFVLDAVYEKTNDPTFLWHENYKTYETTRMTVDDRILTDKRFNSLRYNIGIHYSTGISDVTAMQEVNGKYVLQLVKSLNGIIEKFLKE